MRRQDREITDREEILAVIRRCDVCRLAFQTDDYPYIVPLNFGLEEEPSTGTLYLYFHSATDGRKLELMNRDNRVGFELDCEHRLERNYEKQTCTMHYESVIGTGLLEILPDSKKLHGLEVLMEHYPGAPSDPEFVINEKVLPITTVYRLKVEAMTGKRR